MSLDTKYRPRRYEDVLGQEATVTILREYVTSGRGFHQSYLFCGGHGSGKTTLGRILARALLCENPQGGNPCDQCTSCRSMLNEGSSLDFVEVDAATNSGKADVTRITEEIQYATFSGKRRIYLFDESHQLSTDALDALLKPLEENVPGSDDKKLVCIFCTTEPEKMRATVLSRCAPVFIIRPQPPKVIAQRLALICNTESIPYEDAALALIADITECHIRDALKAVEGISMLGEVSVANAATYLHLDLNLAYLDVLEALGTDLKAAMSAAAMILQRVSPQVCYHRLAETAMLAFQVHLGMDAPVYWNKERLQALAQKGITLLTYSSRFASRPGRPTSSMLMCDLAQIHHTGGSVTDPNAVVIVQSAAAPVPSASTATPTTVTTFEPSKQVVPATAVPTEVQETKSLGKIEFDRQWGYPEPRAVKPPSNTEKPRSSPAASLELTPESFARSLASWLLEGRNGGSKG